MLHQSSANPGCRLLFSLKRHPSKGWMSYGGFALTHFQGIMVIREARKVRQQRLVEGTIPIALLFVALLCAASVASLQTIYLGQG
jgi:hypothetical protein